MPRRWYAARYEVPAETAHVFGGDKGSSNSGASDALYFFDVFAHASVGFLRCGLTRIFDPLFVGTRSAYLVTFLGLVLLIQQALNINLNLIVLFGAPRSYFRNSLVSAR